MEESVARPILASVFAKSFAGGNDRIAGGIKTEAKGTKDEYTSEPTVFERFRCFLSGMSYAGGSYFDADGECRVEGELILKNHRGR